MQAIQMIEDSDDFLQEVIELLFKTALRPIGSLLLGTSPSMYTLWPGSLFTWRAQPYLHLNNAHCGCNKCMIFFSSHLIEGWGLPLPPNSWFVYEGSFVHIAFDSGLMSRDISFALWPQFPRGF